MYEITIEEHTFEVSIRAKWIAQDSSLIWYSYAECPVWEKRLGVWRLPHGSSRELVSSSCHQSQYPASENLYQIIDAPSILCAESLTRFDNCPMPFEEWLDEYPTLFRDPARAATAPANSRLPGMARSIAALTWRYLSQFIPTDSSS